jgi:IS30 family transposase
MKIIKDNDLRDFIDRELLKFQSPKAISGRLSRGIEKNCIGRTLPYVSRSAIERYLNSIYCVSIRFELNQLQKRYKKRRKRPASQKLNDRVFIDERPKEITNRERIGDLEIDFLVSGKDGEGYLLSAVDRKSRVSFIRKLWPVTADNLKVVLLDIQSCFPELKSITADNDILLTRHNELAKLLDVPFYFCHPYSSWEKGSVENLNKFIRRFIPKGSNLSLYNENLILEIESLANSRFMDVLDYLTPLEILEQERSN